MAVLGVAAASASANLTLDLTTAGSSGWINGAYFLQIDNGSTGTGVINPFVRLQANGTQHGLNTDNNKPEYDEKTGKWTHSLRVNDIPTVTSGGIEYFVFLLDINQSNPTLLSLNAIQIYLSSTSGALTNISQLGAPVFDLDVGTDGDGTVKMDYDLNPGSGYGDMFAYIPKGAITGNPYLYLYSSFGVPDVANAGFEEWATFGGDISPPPVVPAPAAAGLVMVGLGLVGFMKRRLA